MHQSYVDVFCDDYYYRCCCYYDDDDEEDDGFEDSTSSTPHLVLNNRIRPFSKIPRRKDKLLVIYFQFACFA